MANRQKLVVIGNGMVGHSLIEKLVDSGASAHFDITVFCEESRLAYDRVHLSEFFAGKSADDLALTTGDYYQQQGIEVRIGSAATAIDREQKKVAAADGSQVAYDQLVLATGSYPFVPPMPGHDRSNCLVYRTIEDLEALTAAAKNSKVGAVVGGGLLGLEAAKAVKVESSVTARQTELDQLQATLAKLQSQMAEMQKAQTAEKQSLDTIKAKLQELQSAAEAAEADAEAKREKAEFFNSAYGA